jgi:hypothetical protein
LVAIGEAEAKRFPRFGDAQPPSEPHSPGMGAAGQGGAGSGTATSSSG